MQSRGRTVGDRREDTGDRGEGRHRTPAQARRAVAAAVHGPPDGDGESDHGCRVRLSFRFVGVERLVGQHAAQDAGQLPRQIVRVAQARAHALADERRRQMRGVPEEEHSPVPPPIRHLRTEGVLGDAHEVERRARGVPQPRAEQRLEGGEVTVVLGALVVVEFELPAVASLTDAHERGRAVRIAELVHALPQAELVRAGDIDDEPPLLGSQRGHPRPQGGAHRAVRSVAPQHRVRRDGAADAGGDVPQDHTRPAVLVDHVDDLDAAAEGHRGGRQHGVAKDPLEFRLIEHVGRWISVRTRIGVAFELGQGGQVRIHQA